MNKIKGKIIKGIGGFYYVETADGIYECKARGLFRKEGITPLVGDNVAVCINNNAENTIDEIFERKNFLVRPPLANIDVLFIVSSLKDPDINVLNIDKLAAIAEFKSIEPIFVFTKSDLSEDALKYISIYKDAGFTCFVTSSLENKSLDSIKDIIKNKICAFTGNSGVGKSTLLNMLDSSLNLTVGQTSKKLGRGKHTTRHCELVKTCGGYVADTPGFSSIDFLRCESIEKEQLAGCFREFAPYLDKCKFTSCTHCADKGCAVCEAVKQGNISELRHGSYVAVYNQIKDVKKWQS